MSKEDTASTGRENAPETAQETESSGSTTKPKTKKKQGKAKTTRGRRSVIGEEVWAELREQYESGNYSQRDLVTLARHRFGIILTQPRIARKAGEQGWIKGVRLDEIRETERERVRNEVGQAYRTMLGTHEQQSRLMQAEVTRHLSAAQEARRADPHYKIPAVQLRSLTSTLREAQDMQARALGFDYSEGRPFKSPDEEADKQIESMRIDVMSEAEEAKIRDAAEREAEGLLDQADED